MRNDIVSDAEEIRKRIEQVQAEQKSRSRKTMTVLEMRKLLGLKKTESYWLVHKGFFKTMEVEGKMRVDLASFEKWYANQVKYKKVNGEEPGQELRNWSYSFREAANLLGIHEVYLYEIWKKENLETFTVDFVKRIPKDVFEEWYQKQDRYQKVDMSLQGDEFERNYISMQAAAILLGITKKELNRLSLSKEYREMFDVITIDKEKWILRRSFQNFLNAQNEYRVVNIEETTTENPIILETKKYISREEAEVLAGVSGSTITRWMQAGRFSCVGAGKVLRIHREEFLQWINREQEGVK